MAAENPCERAIAKAVIVEEIIGLPAVLRRCRRANKNKPNEMLMTDNRIELEEPVVRRAQQNNRNKKSVFDRAN
ncbi:MAG TPA: hypothetical protein VFH87_10725 [Candidatus Udaeobacter sp.]|nr:hypothetical protein [Candidatus Udaeobacter sp.]